MSADRDRGIRRQKQTRAKNRKKLARQAKPASTTPAAPADAKGDAAEKTS